MITAAHTCCVLPYIQLMQQQRYRGTPASLPTCTPPTVAGPMMTLLWVRA
jgi:hypothetical protein